MYESHTSEYQRRLLSEDLERRLAAEIANREKCCRDGNAISDELFDTQQKLKKAEAEVERLQTLPESRHKAFLDLLERAEKAKAEVAKLNHQLINAESDLLQSQDINSFLDVEFRIACKRAERAEAEVERLKDERIYSY
jgi:hypothetical protein